MAGLLQYFCLNVIYITFRASFEDQNYDCVEIRITLERALGCRSCDVECRQERKKLGEISEFYY